MPDKLTPRLVSNGPRRLLIDPSDRIMSRADSEALFKRIAALATGGGSTQVTIRSTWSADVRWARNRPISLSDTIEQKAVITRRIDGKQVSAKVNRFDDESLKKVVNALEKKVRVARPPNGPNPEPLGPQKYLTPSMWSDATFGISQQEISDTAYQGVRPVVEAKFMAAGSAAVGAVSWAIFNTLGLDAYAAATGARCSQIVRTPDGTGSGWGGGTHTEWAKLDIPAISARALKNCRDSSHPVKIEPGRYTTVLDPEAASLVVFPAVRTMGDRRSAEALYDHPYYLSGGKSKIGLRVFDERITITSDPTDPECSFIPFDPTGYPYSKVTWVEKGVLKELAYDRAYAIEKLNTDAALPLPEAFRMSGGNTTVEEMIASTERGLYVAHFGGLTPKVNRSLSESSVTRFGVWLIEHGKIAHPVNNMWINESCLTVLNQVEQLGPPARLVGVQSSGALWGDLEDNLPAEALNGGRIPVVVPPMKIKDFNFTRLTDAI